MKAKTIKSILSKKFNSFLESIEDEEVKKLVKENTIITGGSIVSMLLNEKVNDYDLYFRNRETVLAVANYYVAKFKDNPPNSFKDSDEIVRAYVDDKEEYHIKIVIKSAGIASDQGRDDYQYFEGQADEVGQEYVGNVMDNLEKADEVSGKTIEEETKPPSHRPIFLSSNAITLSDKIQIVIRFFGDVEEIHKNYDFVHCTSSWTSWDGKLNLRADAMECILGRELRYIGSKYPLCSIIRIRKFVHRGWRINAGQILKMCMNLNEFNLTDVNVLEDQLTGVDTAYFVRIIEILKKKQDDELEKNPDAVTKIDGAYLTTIIDKMF